MLRSSESFPAARFMATDRRAAVRTTRTACTICSMYMVRSAVSALQVAELRQTVACAGGHTRYAWNGRGIPVTRCLQARTPRQMTTPTLLGLKQTYTDHFIFPSRSRLSTTHPKRVRISFQENWFRAGSVAVTHCAHEILCGDISACFFGGDFNRQAARR